MQNQRKNYSIFPDINHWWTTGTIRSEFAENVERNIFSEVVGALNESQILLIKGPRRVGKTTMLFQIIQYLLSKQIPAKHLFYLSLDDPLLEKASLFEDIVDFIEQVLLSKPLSEVQTTIYIFLDEITKFPDWELYLKRYYDLKYPFKFIASSSSATFLHKKVKESLVGRVITFDITPFTFSETLKHDACQQSIINCYQQLREIWKTFFLDANLNIYNKLTEINKALFFHQRKIKTKLHTYLLNGGFPEYLQLKNERTRFRYFWENVAERVVFHDIPEIFKVDDRTLLQNLLINAIENSGRQLNFNDLANSFQAPRQKISNYLQYLQAGHLLYLLEKYAKTTTSRMRAYKKVYTADPGLFVNILRLDVNKIERHGLWGILAELAVFLHLKNYAEMNQMYYYREREKEVDFVLDSPAHHLFPIEVKYRSKFDPKYNKRELAGMLYFLNRFSTPHALVISRDLLQLNDNILIVPLHLFLS